MDEFSQSRAEEMEMTMQTAQSGVLYLASIAGVALGTLSLVSKNINGAVENLFSNKKFSPLLLIPAFLYAAPLIISSVATSIFCAKQETKASRLARAEAMNEKLNSPKQFAILTDEQNKQVEAIAKNINISKDEVKKENKTTKGFGVINSIKTALFGNKESNGETANSVNQELISKQQ